MLNKEITKLNNQTVNNQLIETKFKTQEVILKVIMIFLLIGMIIFGFSYFQINDPYVQEVLLTQGNTTRGQAIFKVNCAGCHDNTAYRDVGPSLYNITKHKSQRSLINQVISGKTPPMPKFQPSAQDMADLLSYLETL